MKRKHDRKKNSEILQLIFCSIVSIKVPFKTVMFDKYERIVQQQHIQTKWDRKERHPIKSRPYIIPSMRLQQSNNKPLSARLIVWRNFIKNIGHDNRTFRRQKSEERMRFASSRRQTRATDFLRNVRHKERSFVARGCFHPQVSSTAHRSLRTIGSDFGTFDSSYL